MGCGLGCVVATGREYAGIHVASDCRIPGAIALEVSALLIRLPLDDWTVFGLFARKVISLERRKTLTRSRSPGIGLFLGGLVQLPIAM